MTMKCAPPDSNEREVSMTQAGNLQLSATRVVLFTTPERHPDIPGDADVPACMLQLGTASFIERVLDSCALAGVREVDLVVSEQPECLRKLLRDGGRWGIRLNWQYAKDTASPYKVLRGMGLNASDRIVIGHANQWVASRVIRDLLRNDGVAVNVGDDLMWTGWLCTEVRRVFELSPNEDYPSLARWVHNLDRCRCVIAADVEYAQVRGADDLLQAQKHALDGSQESAIPASWRRFPWGAASPDAFIHANANIEGPVLIGPGCVVEKNTGIGAGTVLSRDVFVACGARIKNAVVLSNTYVGGQITLENALAQGNSIQNLKWSVRTVLRTADALVTPLQPQHTSQTSTLSQLLAALSAAILLPAFVPCVLAQKLRGGAWLWRSQVVVKSRLESDDSVEWVTVRIACGTRASDRAVAHFGALMDVVQGRRNWFGLRPRRESEWYALGRDWQRLFGRTAIGLFYAPAWTEDSESLDHEAFAAADAFMAVQSTMAGRLRAVCSPLLRSYMQR